MDVGTIAFGRDVTVKLADTLDEFGQFRVALVVDGKELHVVHITGRDDRPGEIEIFRVDGRALCPHCGKPYYDHPHDMVNVDYTGEWFLYIGCDGRRLKT